MAITISSVGNWYHVVASVASTLNHIKLLNRDKVVDAGYNGNNYYVTYAKN